MNDVSFLSYFPDPFDVKDSRYFVASQGEAGGELTGRQLSDFDGALVTYESQALLDDMRRAGVRPPKLLIDIGDAIRLNVGIARDDGGERAWNLWRNLGDHFDSPEVAKLFEQITRSRVERPEAAVTRELLVKGADALRSFWRVQKKALNDRGELERFINIDVPVQQIFSYRQVRGVAVDKVAAEILLRDVATEKYLAYAKVADMLRRSPAGLGFWNIQSHLARTDAADLAEERDGGRLRELFKLASSRSVFAREYLSYSDADRDEAVLRRSVARDGRLYPEFQSHGTVTGRILISDPFIQQLRRKYRKIIIADDSRKLAYLDYSQFEPGILAFLSGDKGLIDAYNGGDIYEKLSISVYGDPGKRSTSKRIFLAYSYGMSSDRIAKLLVGESAGHAELAQIRGGVGAFFDAYPGLQAFRESMQLKLRRDGCVSSLWGNHRWRASQGDLSNREKRWAMNHPVQATASLVFKEALISLGRRFGLDAVVLPMHDAVLLQLPDDKSYSEQVNQAKQCMIQAYVARCPEIEPRVTISDFGVSSA